MDQLQDPPTEALATPGARLVTDRGRTSVSGLVVEKIALAAAELVPGVQRVGGSGRGRGGIRDIIPGSRGNGAPGASAEVGQRQAAVDLGVSLEYGTSVADVAGGVRATVIGAIEALTGLEVTEVNVAVEELRVPEQVAPSELSAPEPGPSVPSESVVPAGPPESVVPAGPPEPGVPAESAESAVPSESAVPPEPGVPAESVVPPEPGLPAGPP